MCHPSSLSFIFHCPLGICHGNGFVTHKRHKNGTRKEGGIGCQEEEEKEEEEEEGEHTTMSMEWHDMTWHGMA